jgi:hypothetical protein
MAEVMDGILSCWHASRYCAHCRRPCRMAIETFVNIIRTRCEECLNETELPRLPGTVIDPFIDETMAVEHTT